MKLTKTLYLSALPLVGTAVAYLFEFGFASYHGIPSSLIQLNISQFVAAAVLGLLPLWIIHLYLSLGFAFLARRKLLIFKFAGLGMLYAMLPFLFLIGVGNDKRIWIGFFVLFLTPLILGLFGALFKKDKNQPFTQRWWKQSEELLEPPKSTDGLELVIDAPQRWFSVIFVSAILAYSVGYRFASFATPTLVTKTDKSKALVAIYSDRWFFRPISEANQPRKTSKGELIIRSGDSVKELTLLTINKQQEDKPH